MIFEYLLILNINKINRVQQLSLECHTLIDDHIYDIFNLEISKGTSIKCDYVDKNRRFDPKKASAIKKP